MRSPSIVCLVLHPYPPGAPAARPWNVGAWASGAGTGMWVRGSGVQERECGWWAQPCTGLRAPGPRAGPASQVCAVSGESVECPVQAPSPKPPASANTRLRFAGNRLTRVCPSWGLLHQPPECPFPSHWARQPPGPALSLPLRICTVIQTPGVPAPGRGGKVGEEPRTPIKSASECQRVDSGHLVTFPKNIPVNKGGCIS